VSKEEFYARAADAFLSWQYRGKAEQASAEDMANAVEAVTAVLDAVGAWETDSKYRQRRSEAEDSLRALTPGGSEFQTVEECVAFVRQQYADLHSCRVQRVQLRRELDSIDGGVNEAKAL
jgi:hypothetical protein